MICGDVGFSELFQWERSENGPETGENVVSLNSHKSKMDSHAIARADSMSVTSGPYGALGGDRAGAWGGEPDQRLVAVGLVQALEPLGVDTRFVQEPYRLYGCGDSRHRTICAPSRTLLGFRNVHTSALRSANPFEQHRKWPSFS